jgi:hypothetical protein
MFGWWDHDAFAQRHQTRARRMGYVEALRVESSMLRLEVS